MPSLTTASVPVVAVAAALCAAASAAPVLHVTIRHQTEGCHSWSVDGGPWSPSQAVTVPAGTTIEFTNDDVMTHRLVEVSGPRLSLPPAMRQATFRDPGAGTVRVVFARPGVYRLRTVDSEDGPRVATTGADNVLRLTVRVT